MAKNFPYFKFTVTEWMTGDIVYENFDVQGLFINVCALYWQRDGHLSIEDINKRYKAPDQLKELTDRFIVVKDGFISIKFLDEQLVAAGHISKTNSDNGKLGGRPKSLTDKEKKPTALLSESESKPIKSKEEKEQELNKEKETKEQSPSFDFVELLSFINKSFNRIGPTEFKLINKSVKASFNARLKDGYTKLDVKNCILNLVNDSFHKEKLYKYCTPEYISRAKTMEKHSSKTVISTDTSNPQSSMVW